MDIIIFGIYIFLDILKILVWLDVLISWISVFGLNVRPAFFKDLIDPIYGFIERHIPTNFGPFTLRALIVLILIWILQAILLSYFPNLQSIYSYFGF